MVALPEPEELIKSLGEPVVNSALNEVLNANIPSPTAKRALQSFSKKWKDYSRAALMIMSCRAVGGDPSHVVPAAKALVLSGGAFGLHDDIVDSSYIRTDKHARTTLGLFGKDVTLLVGDALLIEGMSHLYELNDFLPKEKVAEVVMTIKNGLYELGSGEVEELKLVRNLEVTPQKYLKIVRMKAGDVESYTRIGAMIGGGTKEETDALGLFGRYLGMVAILRDDIEDTFNDRSELSSRITKESLPLPIVYSLNDLLCKKKIQAMINIYNEKDLDDLLALIEKNEGFEKTKLKIEQFINGSKLSLKRAKHPSELLSLFKN